MSSSIVGWTLRSVPNVHWMGWLISMGWHYVSELLPLTDILSIPQMIWVWKATVEWYWLRKAGQLGEKPVPVSLCPPQIPQRLTRAQTRASVVRGRRLTAWAMARPYRTGCSKSWTDRLNSHFLHPPPTLSRDVSASRKPFSTGSWNIDVSADRRTVLGPVRALDKLGVSPSQYHHPRSTSQSPGDE
jgi:hypothetical protein